MIELRWLTRKTGDQVINKYGLFEDGKVTVLQYRQKLDVTARAGGPGQWTASEIARTANYQWSKWEDVPSFTEEPATQPLSPVTKDQRKCPKCGIELKDVMSYYCSQLNCPTGLGSSTSL